MTVPRKRLSTRLWHALAFFRVPGNGFSFLIRQVLHWSKGKPPLADEPKDNLFAHLKDDPEAQASAMAKERAFFKRYRLEPLFYASTQSLYRKNLYLLDLLEKATHGLEIPIGEEGNAKAIDVGSQDWHYVFALERWLRYGREPSAPFVFLRGIEIDGYGVYADFHSRKDYALAYAAQTHNAEVFYEINNFIKSSGEPGTYDIITLFYPFVTRYALVLWGLPLRFFSPEAMVSKASALLRSGGWLIVLNQNPEEQEVFLELARLGGELEMVRKGPASSDLVDFREAVKSRQFSIWRRMG